MTSLQERLFAMQDKQYAAFQAKLTPGVPVESFIGIRVPVLRKFTKEFTKETEYLEIPVSVRNEESYVKMMVAWFFGIGGSCDYGHKERAGGAAVVIEHNGNIISRDVISDLHTTEFRMMLTLMVKVMQEIPDGSDILFLTHPSASLYHTK